MSQRPTTPACLGSLRRRNALWACWGLAALVLAGCIGNPANPAATQPVTLVSPATTQPAHWLAQPAAATVQHGDFQRLWDACESAMRQLLFRPDRREYRTGLLTSEPVISAQWFEPWRRDTSTCRDVAEGSLAQVRRTIYCQFRRNDDGTFTVAPKVLVERQARVEQKLRAVVDYDPAYWYPIRRDEALERRLAQMIARELR